MEVITVICTTMLLSVLVLIRRLKTLHKDRCNATMTKEIRNASSMMYLKNSIRGSRKAGNLMILI